MIDKLVEQLPIIPCQRATELMSLSLERRLSLKETVDLKLHLAVCIFCVRFFQHIKGLRNILRMRRRGLKARIKQALKPA